MQGTARFAWKREKKEIALILFDLSVSFIFVQLRRQERMLQE